MKILALLLLLASPLSAQVVGAFETFTEADNADGWNFYDFATDETTAPLWKLPGTTDAEIYGTFTSSQRISLFANEISSEQYFIGDYTDAGIDLIECEIFIEDAATLQEVEFYLVAGGTTYYSNIYEIDESGWAFLTYSLTKEQWYLYNDAEEDYFEVNLTETILSDVTEIGLNFLPTSDAAIGKAVALDNFTLLPDLTPPTLKISQPTGEVGVVFEQSPGISYDLQMSTTLQENDWSGLDADTSDIRGEGNYEIYITARPKCFFRITTYPLFIEVP